MKRFVILTAAIAGILSFGSCEKEDYGEPPVYGKIILTPSEPFAGDSVKATIQVQKQGNGIVSGEYTWKVNGKSEKLHVTDPIKNEPSYTFAIDKPGSYTIECSAILRMSKELKSGQIYSSASAKSTSFVVKAKPEPAQ